MEKCYHCGDACINFNIKHQDKFFCCTGCKTVFEILNDHNLTYYYDLQSYPGKSPSQNEDEFDFLDNASIVEQLIEFDEQDTQVVSFVTPHIHCSSCIWILENLNRLRPGIKSSQVNFLKKSVRITYNSSEVTLKELVLLLIRIGYEPNISLENLANGNVTANRKLIYQLGVAGFAFGNIMFLSFPEYFEVHEFWLERFKYVFRWLMYAFALPVVFYSSRDYFISAFKGLRSGYLNIDVPIAMGISVLFLRSTVDVLMNWGSGFFDSLAGLVFFLLLGRFFQQKTYGFLSFERDYKSYFPIAVTQLVKKKKDQSNIRSNRSYEEVQTPVYELIKGDRILIRHNELIPVDGILLKGTALIDYSFVTGEALPIKKAISERLYAGGKQQSGAIEMEVRKTVKQSYLTQLWNHKVFKTNKAALYKNITDRISRRFTIVIVSLATIASFCWLPIDIAKAFNVFTAVLIVACPCAIALAAPFTLGNMLRIFGKHRLYLKEGSVIEQMAHIDTVVFDKTGTLTTQNKSLITYKGISLKKTEQNLLTSTLRASTHPLSRALYKILQSNDIYTLDDFSEVTGMGVTGIYGESEIKIGRPSFVNREHETGKKNNTRVHISSNGEYKGCYVFYNNYREGMEDLFSQLGTNMKLIVLSGDNEGEKEHLQSLLSKSVELRFNQKPEDKLNFIKGLQKKGRSVMMVGDGLNDAGALAQSDVGIAISEDVNVFSPACDGIMDARMFKRLAVYLALSRKSVRVIKYAFIFSLFYNMIGLGFAVSGYLAPVVAAILMPLSSISIVVFTTIYTSIIGRQLSSWDHPKGKNAI